jgi:Tetratricopeptide repeat
MSQQRDVLDDRWPLDGQSGPARRVPDRQARAMVQAALAAMDAALAATADAAPAAWTEPASQAPAAPRPRVILDPVTEIQATQSGQSRLRGRRFVWLLAAAIVVTAAATSAGVYRWLDGQKPPRDRPAEIGRESGLRAPTPETPETPEAPPPPVAADEPAPAPAPAEQPAPPSPVPEVAERPRPRPTRAEARAERRARAQAARIEPATRGTPAGPPTPDDLMKQANEQRRARQWRTAEALYQRVLDEHPGTSAAHVAAIAAAAIRLDHLGDARGALRLYRTALAGGRALAEEARWGMAEAHRALDDAAGEKRALEDFVTRHPGSPLIPQARTRLRALQAETP